MKKIVLLLIILMSIAGNCFASDNRWAWVASCSGENDWYIDTETTQFYVGSSNWNHSKHNCAKVWLLNCDYTDDVIRLSRVEIDLDCVMLRFLSEAIYKSDKTQVSSDSTTDSEFKNIIPETVGEEVYIKIINLKNIKNANTKS